MIPKARKLAETTRKALLYRRSKASKKTYSVRAARTYRTTPTYYPTDYDYGYGYGGYGGSSIFYLRSYSPFSRRGFGRLGHRSPHLSAGRHSTLRLGRLGISIGRHRRYSTGTTHTDRDRTGTTRADRDRTGTTRIDRHRTGTTHANRRRTGTTRADRLRTGTTRIGRRRTSSTRSGSHQRPQRMRHSSRRTKSTSRRSR